MNKNIANNRVAEYNPNKLLPRFSLNTNDKYDRGIKKVENNTISKDQSCSVDMRQKELPRGPLKADHSIKLSQKKQSEVKFNQVNILPLKKTNSMSDISSRFSDDDEDNFKRLFEKNIYNKNQLTVKRRSIELLNNAKLKLNKLGQPNSQQNASLHKTYGSSNDINSVTEHISNINFLNHNSMEPDLNSQSDNSSNEINQYDKKLKRSSSEINLNQRSSKFDSSVVQTSPRRHSLPSRKGQSNIGHGLVGLQNLGNTCYMNCVLQCLFKTKLLRDYFLTFKESSGKLANAFAQVLKDVWSKNAPNYISPTNLKNHIQKYASRFAGSNQQDAQELLRFLLEGIHDDLNTVKKKAQVSILDDKHLSDEEKSNVYWDRYLTRESSPMQDIFVGQLKSILTCSVCQYRSVTYDPFWDLSLPIPSSVSSTISLTKCFQAYTQEETLDGEEKPICEKCKRSRKCYKGFLIERFPKVLVLHLKRFSGQRFRNKLETKIEFPKVVSLKEFSSDCSDQGIEPVYNLYGVVNHTGGTLGGHYTSFVKHPDNESWHIYNDSIVGETNISRIVSASAYLLFYELSST